MVGVAPGATIHNIKVLGDNGETDISNVVAGIEHVVGQKLQDPNTPMVINLSLGADLGTTDYSALDLAVDAAVANGVTVVASAGNDGIDAATVTPAHAAGAITVGAYDVFNQFAPFSNFGATVDLLAPGADVLSLALNGSGQVERALSDGTSQAAAHVTGAAALFLAENPNATPAQVKNALLATARSFVHGTPAGTTDKSVWVGLDLTDIDLPPFFQYAAMSDASLDLNGQVHVGIEPGGPASRNANLFTNGNIVPTTSNNLVEGFGYHGGNLQGPASIFQPNYNPTNEPVHRLVEYVDIPAFDPDDFQHTATQATHDNVYLAGHYELGTCQNPFIWYIEGNVETTAEASFAGYGVLLVKGNVILEHDVVTSSSGSESTLGLYTNGKVELTASNISLAAQIYANSGAVFEGNTTLYGSVITRSSQDYKGVATLYYRPASPALTEPFWPIGNWDGQCAESDGGTPPPPPAPSSLTISDHFASVSFTGSDGSQDWASAWTEHGESNGTSKGRVRVLENNKCASGNCLRLAGRSANRGVSRAMDLSGASWAMLRLDSHRNNFTGANARLEVSTDGGATWTTLKTYSDGSDGGQQPEVHDLSPYLGGTLQLRLYSYGDGSGQLYLDNVEIENDSSGHGGGY